MKRIWYLKAENGNSVRAAKAFLYEKNGRMAGKMDLSAFRKEAGKQERIVLWIRDLEEDRQSEVNLLPDTLSYEAFLCGKGQLREELAEWIGNRKTEVALGVAVGDKKYFSQDFVKEENRKKVETPDRKPESEGASDALSEEKQVFLDENEYDKNTAGTDGGILEAEELDEDRQQKGKRVVRLSVLEDELLFRNYLHNSFLLHGYYNYGHVIVDESGEEARLGVPGNFYERERMVAQMFGFPDFEAAREGEKISNGTFGYYYTRA